MPSPSQASQRPPGDVEGEAPRAVAAQAGLGDGGEEVADRREDPGVGRRVRARRAADRALVDVDHLVDVLQPHQLRERRRALLGAVQRVGERLEERLDDQRALARAGDAGDAGQRPERDLEVDPLEVVAARADQAERLHAGAPRAPGSGSRASRRGTCRSASPGGARSRSGVPAATRCPPCSPAPGPRSRT